MCLTRALFDMELYMSPLDALKHLIKQVCDAKRRPY